jgi:hypothetical protein
MGKPNPIMVLLYIQRNRQDIVIIDTYDVRSLDILNTLSWETLDNRRKKSKAVFMYIVLNDHLPYQP